MKRFWKFIIKKLNLEELLSKNKEISEELKVIKKELEDSKQKNIALSQELYEGVKKLIESQTAKITFDLYKEYTTHSNKILTELKESTNQLKVILTSLNTERHLELIAEIFRVQKQLEENDKLILQAGQTTCQTVSEDIKITKEDISDNIKSLESNLTSVIQKRDEDLSVIKEELVHLATKEELESVFSVLNNSLERLKVIIGEIQIPESPEIPQVSLEPALESIKKLSNDIDTYFLNVTKEHKDSFNSLLKVLKPIDDIYEEEKRLIEEISKLNIDPAPFIKLANEGYEKVNKELIRVTELAKIPGKPGKDGKDCDCKKKEVLNQLKLINDNLFSLSQKQILQIKEIDRFKKELLNVNTKAEFEKFIESLNRKLLKLSEIIKTPGRPGKDGKDCICKKDELINEVKSKIEDSSKDVVRQKEFKALLSLLDKKFKEVTNIAKKPGPPGKDGEVKTITITKTEPIPEKLIDDKIKAVFKNVKVDTKPSDLPELPIFNPDVKDKAYFRALLNNKIKNLHNVSDIKNIPSSYQILNSRFKDVIGARNGHCYNNSYTRWKETSEPIYIGVVIPIKVAELNKVDKLTTFAPYLHSWNINNKSEIVDLTLGKAGKDYLYIGRSVSGTEISPKGLEEVLQQETIPHK